MKNTAVLRISCPDKKGIVAFVADFLYKHNANILHADEHQDSQLGLFFLRVEWDMTGFQLTDESFRAVFGPLASSNFQMDWQISYSKDRPRVALFVSHEDHCLEDLLYRHRSGELACEIPVVISNHADVKRLVDFYQIPFYEFGLTPENKIQQEGTILKLLQEKQITLAVLARYMQILSSDFIRHFKHPIINIHHSFLPAFVGAKPYHQAYDRGVKLIGATAHYVTEDLDQGPIIEQDTLRISHRDSIEDLIQKGKDIEKMVLSRAVKNHIEHRVLTYSNKTVVFD